MSEPFNGALDSLVTQFSSPFDCFRELVQNSIDANTPRIEVWTEYIAGDAEVGTIAMHVDDMGEGMDERIVDDQLTRLFASNKENDLTKIGKFGIGFVSVFALAPKAVLVHTGRGGDCWEVLFHEDRSFSKTKLDVPVEGTQITIFVAGSFGRYREIVHGAHAALSKWCVHSTTEIEFEDRSPPGGPTDGPTAINAPFSVEGECAVIDERPGTTIALAFSSGPIYGFYNRGLTLASTRAADQLLDHRAPRFEHISVKVKSRYLEHTLSRESVLRDENYEKAMKCLEEAANGPLVDALGDALAKLAAQPGWGVPEIDTYARLAAFLEREPPQSILRLQNRPILRTATGDAVSPKRAHDSYKKDGRLLVADGLSDLVAHLDEQGVCVLLGRPHDEGEHALSTLGALAVTMITAIAEASFFGLVRSGFFGVDLRAEARKAVTTAEKVYYPVHLDEHPPEELASLIDAAQSILRKREVGYRRLVTCRLAAPVESPPLFVVARKFGSKMAKPPPKMTPHQRARVSLDAAINLDHPHLATLLAIREHSPEMAAYCLAKGLLLTEDHRLDADEALMTAALGGDHG